MCQNEKRIKFRLKKFEGQPTSLGKAAEKCLHVYVRNLTLNRKLLAQKN